MSKVKLSIALGFSCINANEIILFADFEYQLYRGNYITFGT